MYTFVRTRIFFFCLRFFFYYTLLYTTGVTVITTSVKAVTVTGAFVLIFRCSNITVPSTPGNGFIVITNPFVNTAFWFCYFPSCSFKTLSIWG